MRLSFAALFVPTFCFTLSENFWINVKLEKINWLNDCDLRDVCIHPTLQLRLFNVINNETVSKTLKVNFDQQENSGADLIAYWNEGTADTIVSTITIDGNDPDYDFPRICDSTATIFLFQIIETNITEMSGVCFKVQLTFTKYSDQCSHKINPMIDQTDEKILQTSLIIIIGCLIICLALISVFIIINCIVKFRHENHSQTKRISISKGPITNIVPLNVGGNSEEFVQPQIFPISITSTSLNLMKSPTEVFAREHILSANSSFCYSAIQ